ncbi:hypothetical protein Misp01_23840 [Microtetraspora sp. NBRC 13810]|uniref:hypothetical protein n=1 Tax=Microtetraspora sp. NBRC 13810 TaxID=3030990 RepID=UPI0024A4EFB6|nr:hypothetical protein [Microtetraspora sp. NBRC 13810]GLW07254.1 hypothetical protein Misp01_23840 [Microtetraspora sp. NBRC 13810]
MFDVSETIKKWEVIHRKGLDLKVVRFGKPVANYGTTGDPGAWLFLEGFTVVLGDRDHSAHITITKKPLKDTDGLNWEFCHFTVERAGKNHVFYQVKETGEFHPVDILLDNQGRQRKGKAHYDGDHINDATLVNTIEHDMRQIFLYFA